MERSRQLREQAERCRRLAKTVNDEQTIAALEKMAREYDEQARLAAMREGSDDGGKC